MPCVAPSLSILDLAFVGPGQSPRDAFDASVALAQRAEQLGYRRVWYAEHHNMPTIASSAPSVLIAHVAAHTRTIRLGSGGIMLPNHSPLVIAEQFGTLASLHPGRIDLGLGRAPGTDPVTTRALRNDPKSPDRFQSDVLELQGYLGTETRVPGVEATPGKGTHVPITILGSSLFGARLAARLGLPYAFASHFAPSDLVEAVATYRREFQPSEGGEGPHVIAGLNVVAADERADAAAQFRAVQRSFVKGLFGRGMNWTDTVADEVLESPYGDVVKGMLVHAAVGTRDDIRNGIDRFAELANADELITVHAAPTLAARLRSIELLAQCAA